MESIKDLAEMQEFLIENKERRHSDGSMRDSMDIIDTYIVKMREKEVNDIANSFSEEINEMKEIDKKISELKKQRNKISDSIENSLKDRNLLQMYEVNYIDVEKNVPKKIFVKSYIGFYGDTSFSFLVPNRFYSNLKNTNYMDTHNGYTYKFKIKDVTLQKIN